MSLYAAKPRNIDKIKQKLDTIQHGLKGHATEAVAEWMIGNESRGLQHYPAKPEGSTYNRTYNLRFGWIAKNWGDGTQVRIVNTVPYAGYVQGDKDQAWMHVGRWRTVNQVIASNIKGAIRHAQSVVNKFIKMNG